MVSSLLTWCCTKQHCARRYPREVRQKHTISNSNDTFYYEDNNDLDNDQNEDLVPKDIFWMSTPNPTYLLRAGLFHLFLQTIIWRV